MSFCSSLFLVELRLTTPNPKAAGDTLAPRNDVFTGDLGAALSQEAMIKLVNYYKRAWLHEICVLSNFRPHVDDPCPPMGMVVRVRREMPFTEHLLVGDYDLFRGVAVVKIAEDMHDSDRRRRVAERWADDSLLMSVSSRAFKFGDERTQTLVADGEDHLRAPWVCSLGHNACIGIYDVVEHGNPIEQRDGTVYQVLAVQAGLDHRTHDQMERLMQEMVGDKWTVDQAFKALVFYKRLAKENRARLLAHAAEIAGIRLPDGVVKTYDERYVDASTNSGFPTHPSRIVPEAVRDAFTHDVYFQDAEMAVYTSGAASTVPSSDPLTGVPRIWEKGEIVMYNLRGKRWESAKNVTFGTMPCEPPYARTAEGLKETHGNILVDEPSMHMMPIHVTHTTYRREDFVEMD